MDAARRTQIRLILDDVEYRTRIAIATEAKSLFADPSSKGLLRSRATVRATLRAIEEATSNLVTSAVDRVSGVAKDMEAFTMIRESLQKVQATLVEHLESAVSIATGGTESVEKPGNVWHGAQLLFREIEGRVERQLEIHRFTFTVPSPFAFTVPSSSSPAPSVLAVQPVAKQAGGRRPAEFWDDMWASIAFALYDGTLAPKSQADVERAMLEWIEANGDSAAVSTVRGRARRLWDKLNEHQG